MEGKRLFSNYGSHAIIGVIVVWPVWFTLLSWDYVPATNIASFERLFCAICTIALLLDEATRHGALHAIRAGTFTRSLAATTTLTAF